MSVNNFSNEDYKTLSQVLFSYVSTRTHPYSQQIALIVFSVYENDTSYARNSVQINASIVKFIASPGRIAT